MWTATWTCACQARDPVLCSNNETRLPTDLLGTRWGEGGGDVTLPLVSVLGGACIASTVFMLTECRIPSCAIDQAT